MASNQESSQLVPGGMPKVGLLATAVCMVAISAAVLLGLAHSNQLNAESTPLVVTLLGLVTTTVPGILAAVYSERTARDIRNGVVVEKAREGAVQAIQEQQVITRTGPVVSAELAALTELLAQSRQALNASTDAVRQVAGVVDRRQPATDVAPPPVERRQPAVPEQPEPPTYHGPEQPEV